MNANRRYMKKIWALTVAGLVSTGTLLGCGGTYEEEDNRIIVEQEPEEEDYKLTVAVVGDVMKTQTARCTFSQVDAQEVKFEVSGRLVEKVFVKSGDIVTKGQVLAELAGGNKEAEMAQLSYQIQRNQLLLSQVDDTENYEISRRWLNYQYKSGQSQDEEKALKDGIADYQKYNEYTREDCRDAIEIATQKLNKLRTEERQSRVYAEFDGTVANVLDKLEGTTSNRDTTIMEVVDRSQCLFICEDMSLAPYIKEGQELTMQISTGAGAGTYTMKPYDMESWEDKMLFEVSGVENGAIEAGTSGNLTVVLDQKSHVLSLPSSAVHSAEDKYYVYIVGADNMREVKWVEIGLEGDNTTEIVQGLEEGDMVVLK